MTVGLKLLTFSEISYIMWQEVIPQQGGVPNMAERGIMTVREAGRKGGRTTKRRHGPEFYVAIGRKGGETTKSRHGPDFYEKIGSMGGQKVRQLVARGRRAGG